ncbi:MAG: FeoA domain-containing protein [Acidobacteriota bacterium]
MTQEALQVIDPVVALLAAAAAGALAWALFWPGWGLYWRWMRAIRRSDRVLIEDALKHLYDYEYRQCPCTLHSLSGAAGLSGNQAAEILSRLEQMELVAPAGEAYQLTAAGRGYALQVIRAHRLWERYLSEETGLEAPEWHTEAEYREHTTSSEELEAMVARLSHPRFDPHGDPIPTASGEVGPRQGLPLTELPLGTLGRIVHIEDEPVAIYTQLVAEGFHPGMRVRVLESSPRRIRFEANAREHELAPVTALNLSVVPLPEEQRMEGPFEPLSALNPGQKARVLGLSRLVRGIERRRILDLGIVPGTLVEVEMRSPSGDPTAYRIRGAVIALRREQADMIHVGRLDGGASS